jgi:transcriptional regulator with XRE-family HTH domain
MQTNLAELRAQQNMSQIGLADSLGVTKLAVGRWERGEMMPRQYFRGRLSQIFEEQDLFFTRVEDVPAQQEPVPSSPIYNSAIPFSPAIPLVGEAAIEQLSKVYSRLEISQFQSLAHPCLPDESAISFLSVIEVSDHLLTSLARDALYALSVFPPRLESFSEEAALAIAACSVRELDELLDTELILCPGKGLYQLRLIITNYARIDICNRMLTMSMLTVQGYHFLERRISSPKEKSPYYYEVRK